MNHTIIQKPQKCKILVSGKTDGIILQSHTPINFLGAVNKKTGLITDKKHELYKKSIKNVILVFPSGAGSSVGAYTIYSIKANKVAPHAMICQRADLTIATGCAVADIPLLVIDDDNILNMLNTGSHVTLDTESDNFITLTNDD